MAALSDSQVQQYRDYLAANPNLTPSDIAKAASSANLDSSQVDQVLGAGVSARYGYNQATGTISNPTGNVAPTPAPANAPTWAIGGTPAPTPSPAPYVPPKAPASSSGFGPVLNDGFGPAINGSGATASQLATGTAPGSTKAFDANGNVNIGTQLNPVYADPSSIYTKAVNSVGAGSTSITPTIVSQVQSLQAPADTSNYLANKGVQQYQSIMDFATKNKITPEQAALALNKVNPADTSQYQLDQMLSKDGVLMQDAANQGVLKAGQRGLGDSSLAAGYAQQAMIQAAQPFALQDAQTNVNMDLANQNAANQNNQFNTTNDVAAQTAAYNAGITAASNSYLSNQDYVNKANLAATGAQIDSNKAIGQSIIDQANARSTSSNKAANDILTAALTSATGNITAANTGLNNAQTATNQNVNQNNQAANNDTSAAKKAVFDQQLQKMVNDGSLAVALEQGRVSMANTATNAASALDVQREQSSSAANVAQIKASVDTYISNNEAANKIAVANIQSATTITTNNADNKGKQLVAEMNNANATYNEIIGTAGGVIQNMVNKEVAWPVVLQFAGGVFGQETANKLFGPAAINNTVIPINAIAPTGLQFSSDPIGLESFNRVTANVTAKDIANADTAIPRQQTVANAINAGLTQYVKDPAVLDSYFTKWGVSRNDPPIKAALGLAGIVATA